MSLDFTPDVKDKLYPVKSLRYEFDVRSDGTVDDETAEQIIARGKITRNPLITKDGVDVWLKEALALWICQQHQCDEKPHAPFYEGVGFGVSGRVVEATCLSSFSLPKSL
jgi:hypothetical protein